MDSTPYPAAVDAAAEPPPRRLTPRQERFCQAYVLVPNAARAARTAGYSRQSARKQGWRLLRSRRIRARLAEIQTELATDINDSVDNMIGKLEVVYRQAVEDRRTLAAVRAVELQGRFIQLKRRLPPAAEEAAAAIRAEIERRRTHGRAMADARWARASAAGGDFRRSDDPLSFDRDA